MYNKKTISISTTSSEKYDEIYLDKIISKGDIEITFDISELNSGIFRVLKALYIYDQDSEPLLREYAISSTDFTEKFILHPPETETHYSVTKFPIVNVLLNEIGTNNIYNWIYITPVEIAKTSFFSEHGGLKIIDCQFCNENSDELIGIFKNDNGTILNLKIK